MPDDLDAQARDRLAAIGKGIVAAVPFAGGLLAELVTLAIPNLREERIVAYLRQLAERLDRIEKEALLALLRLPHNVQLVEQGGYAAADASSEEKIGQIATLVCRGLSDDERQTAAQRRLLKLLDEIDDEQYLMLLEEAQFHIKDADKRVRLSQPKWSTYSEGWQATVPRTLFDAGRDELVRLGLLERKLRMTNDGPQMDFGGNDFAYDTKISQLGLLLLQESGFDGLTLA